MKASHQPLSSLIMAAALSFAGCVTAQEAAIPPAEENTPAQGAAEQPDSPAHEPAREADPEVVSLLEKIEAASADLATLRGRVRYTVQQGLLGDQQRRFGDFYYAVAAEDTPTRFALHFDRLIVDDRARPIDRWYIFDGYWLLERNHNDKNATRRELVAPGQARNDTLQLGGNQVPVPLQLKADQVLASYNVSRLPDEAIGEITLYHLRLATRDAGSESPPLDLWFDSKTLMLSKVETVDGDDKIELLLSLVKTNIEIKPEVFKTALPPAADGWETQEVPLD